MHGTRNQDNRLPRVKIATRESEKFRDAFQKPKIGGRSRDQSLGRLNINRKISIQIQK